MARLTFNLSREGYMVKGFKLHALPLLNKPSGV